MVSNYYQLGVIRQCPLTENLTKWTVRGGLQALVQRYNLCCFGTRIVSLMFRGRETLENND